MYSRHITLFCHLLFLGLSATLAYPAESISSDLLPLGRWPPPQVREPGTIIRAPTLTISVIRRGGKSFEMGKETVVSPIVEVRDELNRLVVGAIVIFESPSDGPGIVFNNGSRSMSLITDDAGRAGPVEMRPVGLGRFDISVSARFQEQVATTHISEINDEDSRGVLTGGGVRGRLSPRTIGLLVAVVALAAAGVGMGLAHASASSSVTNQATVIGIGIGASAGAPH